MHFFNERRIRQQTIRALCEILQEETNLEQITMLFEAFKNAEPNILRYWHSQLPINAASTQGLYYSTTFMPKAFNESTAALEAGIQLRNGWMPLTYTQSALVPAFVISMTMESIKNDRIPGANPLPQLTVMKQGLANLRGNLSFCAQSWNSFDTAKKAQIAVTTPLLAAFCYYMTKVAHAGYGLQNDLIRHYQARLMSVNYAIHLAKHLHASLRADATIAELPAMQQLEKFFKGETHSKDFSKLLKMLETNTFEGKPSLLSITGRVLAAHRIMDKTKHELIPLLEAVGHLEAYFAVAKLLINHQDKSARFCFAEFVESEKPSLAMNNFWNPFINADIVVTNNVQLNVLLD